MIIEVGPPGFLTWSYREEAARVPGEVVQGEAHSASDLMVQGSFSTRPRGRSRPLISFYLQRTWFCPLLANCPLRTGSSAFFLNLCRIILF